MSGNIKEITDNDFETEVLKSETPVLVDFWAPWCGPCKSIAPVLDELANDYSGRLKIVKVNVDENQMTPAKYEVRGIPNLIFFKNGEVVDQVIGYVTKEQLSEVVDKVLG
ncbi:MAG: thioredoxin [Candidatus Dadabacteria bacterium]|nr:MAG: thioredoxin [Candidatus Dadabacteria bacterium]